MQESFYQKFRKSLDQHHQWPSVYLFKFIVPDNPLALSRVQALFHEKTQLQYKKSIKGNYISVSGKELMMNAQEVISRYHKAEKIEGIVML